MKGKKDRSEPEWLAKMREAGAVKEVTVNSEFLAAAASNQVRIPGPVQPGTVPCTALERIIRDTPEIVTEAEFQEWLTQCAQGLGILVAHSRPSRTRVGWRTAWAADGDGFPDIVLVGSRIVYCELKRQSKSSQPKERQKLWANRLKAAGGEYYLWRPSDVDEILQVLESMRVKREQQ